MIICICNLRNIYFYKDKHLHDDEILTIDHDKKEYYYYDEFIIYYQILQRKLQITVRTEIE